MMFQAGLQERSLLIEPGLVQRSNTSLHLTEKGEGQADLEVRLISECILIRNHENNKMQYFINKKCADYVMFESIDDIWRVHIFEMKKTVNEEKWENEIKHQFHGAMQNALAFSGVLGVEIADIVLHTVYRNDKINDMANPVRQHLCTHRKSISGTDWNDSEISLEFLDKKRFKHDKIKLDIETGEGEYCLAYCK
ncbi:MAG: hypothetical protein K2O91_07280 [Lachnospiraceae bacterium]|nr:hypothetical protein [Lachnospiraceae bacterium]